MKKENQEALSIIKQVIDAAIKAGLFHSTEIAVNVHNAFNIINEALKIQESS